MTAELVKAFTEMREQEVLSITKSLLESGLEPVEIFTACRDALTIIGDEFDRGKYFIPELIMAGEMMKQVSEVIKPQIKREEETKYLGKVLIGTVAGDIHNIGKDIVVFMLDANGFEVMDLGVDVPAQVFIDKINEFEPSVVGLSGLLTVSFDSMKETVESIEKAGLREKVKIMIGGAVLTEEVCEYVGADALGPDAMSAVTLSKGWLGISRKGAE